VDVASGGSELETSLEISGDLGVHFHVVQWNEENEDSCNIIVTSDLIQYDTTRAYKTITLDSDLSDWAGEFSIVDAVPDADDATGNSNLLRVWLANDATYVYVRWAIGSEILDTDFAVDVHVDDDDNPGNISYGVQELTILFFL